MEDLRRAAGRCAKKARSRWGITGFGSPDEMHVNKFNEKGSKFRSVPFAQPGERYSSILGGHADVLVEQAGDIARSSTASRCARSCSSPRRRSWASNRCRSPSTAVPFAISQFRSIVVRAGTDPAQVATLSAALDKVARSEDFKKYLEDELAFADSYIPAEQAGAFLDRAEARSSRTCRRNKYGPSTPRGQWRAQRSLQGAAMKERCGSRCRTP